MRLWPGADVVEPLVKERTRSRRRWYMSLGDTSPGLQRAESRNQWHFTSGGVRTLVVRMVCANSCPPRSLGAFEHDVLTRALRRSMRRMHRPSSAETASAPLASSHRVDGLARLMTSAAGTRIHGGSPKTGSAHGWNRSPTRRGAPTLMHKPCRADTTDRVVPILASPGPSRRAWSRARQ